MSSKLLYFFLFATFISIGQSDFSLQQGDVTVSFGAGSNRYFETKNFEGTTPFEIPVNITVGLSKKLELGTEFSVTFFNDKTQNGSIQDIDTTKNKSIGNLLNYGGVLKYSLNNTYRSNSYLLAGGGYSDLNKRSWITGRLQELYGEGYYWEFGGALRYHLGNMYDDVFPWFFDFSLTYKRYNFNITEFSVDEVIQPRTESSWDDLKYGSIDVAIKVGYRIRYKK